MRYPIIITILLLMLLPTTTQAKPYIGINAWEQLQTQDLSDLSKSNIKHYRFAIRYEDTQERGWAQYDRLVSDAQRYRIQLHPIIVANKIIGRTYWMGFVHDAVRRYPNIKTWEVWNEPNSKTFWGDTPSVITYKRLLEDTINIIRHDNEKAKIILGGTAWRSDDRRFDGGHWFRMLIDRPLHVDGVAIHTYNPDPQANVEAVEHLRYRLNKTGNQHVKIWLNEFGAPATKTSQEAKQADYISKTIKPLLHKRYGVAGFFWFSYRDVPNVKPEWGSGWTGLKYQDGVKKKAWYRLGSFA